MIKQTIPSIFLQRQQKEVQRCGTVSTIGSYNLMEHGFGVVSIFLDVCKIVQHEPTIAEVEKVLRHDIVETITGDLPYPVKNASEEAKKAWNLVETSLAKHHNLQSYTDSAIKAGFSKISYAAFLLADMADLYYFCIREDDFGNKRADFLTMYGNAKAYTKARCEELAGVVSQERSLSTTDQAKLNQKIYNYIRGNYFET